MVDRMRAGNRQPAVQAGDDLRALGRVLAGSPPDRGLNLGRMADLAQQQGLSALLYWRLAQIGGERLQGDTFPSEAWERLQQDFYSSAAWGLVAERQLAGVLGALAAVEVPVLVIKGPVLGSYYPDPALRTYYDLDVLVPEARLNVAEEALGGLGYHYDQPREWWRELSYHLPPMLNNGERLTLELHWRLDHEQPSGRLPIGDLWTRAVPWSLGGHYALRLDDVDVVLYLCQHAVVQHRLQLGLRPLCDLVQVTKDWDRARWRMLAERAEEYGLSRPVFLALVLAARLMDLAVPAESMSTLRPQAGDPLPEEAVDKLLGPTIRATGRVPLAVVRAGMKPTTAKRLRHLLSRLWLPRTEMAVAYGIPLDSPRIWLTYLRRPLDLLRRYGGSAWGMLRGERAARAAWAQEAWLEHWLRASK